jgi:glutamate synthase domain-containing protein 2
MNLIESEWGTQRILNLFLAWRKELVRILRKLGMKDLKELVGRTECLVHLDYMKKS